MPSARVAVVLLAAGTGTRVGSDVNKVLLPLSGLPVFAWSLRSATGLGVTETVLVIRDDDRATVSRTLREHGPGLEVTLVQGGANRHESEWNALGVLAERIDAGEVDVVAIHDTARPLADSALFQEVVEAAHAYGGALPVREQEALVHRDGSRGPVAGRHVAVQTPQAFRARPLLDAYRAADRDGFVGTDTASCVEEYTGLEIRCVPAPATNLKITFPEDVAVAERLVEDRQVS